jgi:uncharacterized protein YxeA
MKKTLTYLIIMALIVVAAFFVYKKMYGSGMFEKKRQDPTLQVETPAAGGNSFASEPATGKSMMFGD